MEIKLEFADQDREIVLELLNEIKKLNSALTGLGIRSNTNSSYDVPREYNTISVEASTSFGKYQILDDAFYYPKDLMQILNFGKNAVYEFCLENDIPKIKGKYRVPGRKLKMILEGINRVKS